MSYMPSVSPLLRLWHERYARVRRYRSEKITRDVADMYRGYDKWTRCILTPLRIAEEHAVSWNKERIRKIREEAEQMLTG